MTENADKKIPLVPPVTAEQAAQGEALTRPVSGENGQGERQQELNNELDASKIADAKAEFRAGKISVEEFHRRTGTH